jgi:hypothetical protein
MLMNAILIAEGSQHKTSQARRESRGVPLGENTVVETSKSLLAMGEKI